MDRRLFTHLASLTISLFFCLNQTAFGQNRSTADSLLKVVENTDASQLASVYSDLCWEFRMIQQDSAAMFGRKAIYLARKFDQSKALAQAYNDYSIILIDKARFEAALTYLDSSLHLVKEADDSSRLAAIYNKIGIIHQLRGHLKEALSNQMAALTIYRKLNATYETGQCLNNIAIVNKDLGNDSIALAYFDESIQMKWKAGDSVGVGGTYINIGDIYESRAAYDTAISYYRKCIPLTKNSANQDYLSGAYNNMSACFSSLGKLDSAKYYVQLALSIRRKTGDKRGEISSTINLADVLAKQGNKIQAESLLLEALKGATETGLRSSKLSTLNALASLYESESPAIALSYQKRAYALRDSLLGEENRRQINQLQAEYDAKTREDEILQLTQLDEINRLRLEKSQNNLKRQRQYLLLASLLSLLLIIIAISTILWIRQRQINRNQKRELRFQEQLLTTTVTAQEEERKRISKELHDGIAQSLSALKMQFSGLRNGLKEMDDVSLYRFDSSIEELDNACSEVRSISHQMMPRALMERGLIEALEDLFEKTLQNSKVDFHFEEVGMENAPLPKEIEISLYRICQELLNNIIKHANATRVDIQIIKRLDSLMLLVEDDGKGLAKDQSTDGIGLMNIESRLSALQGEWRLESEQNGGTVATIKIPIPTSTHSTT